MSSLESSRSLLTLILRCFSLLTFFPSLSGWHEIPQTDAPVTLMQWPRYEERPSFSKVQQHKQWKRYAKLQSYEGRENNPKKKRNEKLAKRAAVEKESNERSEKGKENESEVVVVDTQLSQLSPAERLQYKNYITLSCLPSGGMTPSLPLTTETRNRLAYLLQ